jgi:hypothetical protein
LSYSDPSDANGKRVKGKHANLEFQIKSSIMNNIDDIIQLNMDYFYRKALPAKVGYTKLSPNAFRPHDFI